MYIMSSSLTSGVVQRMTATPAATGRANIVVSENAPMATRFVLVPRTIFSHSGDFSQIHDIAEARRGRGARDDL